MFGELFSALVEQAPTIGAALVMGTIASKVGRSERTGPLPHHKVGSPIVAMATGALVEGVRAAASGEPYDLGTVARAGGELGGTAVLLHTLSKKAFQYVGAIREHRRETKL